MSKFKGVRRISLSVCFLIITFALLIQVNCAEAGGIGPNQGFDSVTVLAGQKATVDVTQIGPFGMHTVGFLSVGNKATKSAFKIGKKQTPVGIWYVILFAPGGHDYRYLDVRTGLLTAESGRKAEVTTDNWCLGFITAGALLSSPVSAAAPFKYSLVLEGQQRLVH